MKTKKHDTRWLVSVALMAAIIIVLANTPLGMIQLPVIKATTVHIPVILGAILLGPSAGAILGGVFGICSVVSNTMTPTLLSFAFSPFMSTTGIPGAFKALWVAVGCRILLGVAAGWLWILFRKVKLNEVIALPIVGFAGSIFHTIIVMGSIYVLFAQQYAEAKEVAISAVFGLVMGTVMAIPFSVVPFFFASCLALSMADWTELLSTAALPFLSGCMGLVSPVTGA